MLVTSSFPKVTQGIILCTPSTAVQQRDICGDLTLQVSNEIIKRCSTKISLDDIFEGRIKTSMQGLQESIECCESWKHTYSKVSC